MRYLVIVFMIVLLPLRSWAGDVMATQMASSVLAISATTEIAIEKGAVSAHHTSAKTSFDHAKQALETANATPNCHENGLAQQAAQGNVDTTEVSSDHCGTCVACQACHTVALTPVLPDVTIAFTSPQLRQTSSAMFTSADAALGQKPPIV